jgi:hypothetical protein
MMEGSHVSEHSEVPQVLEALKERAAKLKEFL